MICAQGPSKVKTKKTRTEMPTTRVEPDHLMDRLTEVFRTVGYDGATLSKLSEATGLRRASLYHRFPGGKQEMAEAVLSRAGTCFQQHILGPLTGPGTPVERLETMARELDDYYCRGRAPCLLDTLSFGEGGDIFETHIKESFTKWIGALAQLVTEATSCSKAEARERAEEAVVRIQGALVLVRGTRSSKVFRRVLQSLPSVLLEGRR